MGKYYLGIDIGGTTVKFGFFNDNDVLLEKWSIDTDISEDGKKIMPTIAASILNFFDVKNIDELLAIGITIPGPVINGSIVKKAVNLNWKNEFDITKELKRYLAKDIYVYALNDANAAAYGEYRHGAGKKYSDMFMITIGTGIGGGLILGDKLIEGTNGGAAEIGHIKVVDKYQRECNCGGIGCLETISSINGMIWLYEKNIGRSCKEITAKDICDKAKDGDSIACDTLKESMNYIGKALSIVMELVEPKCMVIGGGVSNAGEIIIDYIKEGYDKYSTMASITPKFELAKLGNDAGIYGAMSMAKNMLQR